MDNLPVLVIYLIASIAVWRISHIVSDENGPLDIFLRIRTARTTTPILGSLVEGLNCFMCNSVWFSFIFSLLLESEILSIIVLTFFLSAMSIFINVVFEGSSVGVKMMHRKYYDRQN